MSSSKDPARAFLRRLAITMVASILVWWGVLRTPLDGTVTGAAEILVRAFEYPRVTRLVVEDHRTQIRRSDFRSDSAIPTVSLTEVHFNTIVLLALFLALERPWSRRQLERLFMGWSILFLTQTFNLWLHVKFLYATGLGEWSAQHYSVVTRNILGFLQYFTDLPGRFSFPFLIWLGFNWDVVTSRLLNLAPTGAAGKKRRSPGRGSRRS